MFGDYSTQCEFVATFADFVNTKVGDVQNYLEDVSAFAQAICAFFAVFYVGNIVWKSWVTGERLNVYKSLRPIVIAFFIINFSVVIGFVEFVAQGLTYPTQKFVDKVAQESIAYRAGVADEVKKVNMTANYTTIPTDDVKEVVNNNETQAESKSMEVDAKELSFWDIVTGGSWYNIVFGLIEALINEVCSLLASLVSCCVLMMSFLYRCVLSFFGPFIFALALLPSMEGVIFGFCKKYFTYCLFPAMVNIVNGTLCYAQICLGTSLSSQNAAADMAGSFVSMGMTNVIALLAVFMYGSVPSLAGLITDVAVDRSLGSAALGPVAAGMGVATKAAIKNNPGLIGSVGKWGMAAMTGGSSLAISKLGGMAANKVRGMMGGSKSSASDGNMKSGK